MNRSWRLQRAVGFGLVLVLLLVGCSSSPSATPIPTQSPPPATSSSTQPPPPPTAVSTLAPTARPLPTPTMAAAAAPVFVASLKGDPYPFEYPAAVAVDAQDNLYVIDGKASIVQKFDANGKFITKWGGHDGEFRFAMNMKDWSAGETLNLGCLAIDGKGQVYVADTGNSRIQKFDANGDFLAGWGSAGEGDGQFSDSPCVGVDAQGNVYVSDSFQHRVQKFDENGKFLLKWGSRGAKAGQFNYPWMIVGDPEGNVYVVDMYNNRLQKFDANGNFLAKFDLPPINNRLMRPLGLARDSDGALYINDGTSAVKLDRQGALLAAWGSRGYDDGQFMPASAIAVDSQGYIYVADSGNSRIQKFRQP